MSRASAKRLLSSGLLGLAFVVLALVTRLPFADRTLFISDSVRYALALEHYDMTLGRPHPPGNPLYVAVVAAVDRIVGDPPRSLVLVSAIFSGITFWLAYLLARDLAGEAAGWLAALAFVVSPLFWFFGCVGMPATGEAALSLLFAWTVRRSRAPDERAGFWAMTAVLFLAYGFRSTFALFVAPLWLHGAWRHPRARVILGAGCLVLGAFAWTAAVASLSGGWQSYRATTSAFLVEVVVMTKILGGGLAKLPAQILDISRSVALALGLIVVPFAIGLLRCLAGRPPFPAAGPFLAAWALPMLGFHLVYDWAPRFAVALLPPAVILAATAALPASRRDRGESRGPLPGALATLALAVNLGLFLLPVRLGPLRLPEPYPGGPRLLARNDDLARRDAVIRRSFPAERTLILAYDHTFHVAYFLPEYRVVGLFPLFKATAEPHWVPSARGRRFSFEPGSTALPPGPPLELPGEIERVVLYDDDYARFWPGAALPLTPLAYDVDRHLAVATLPGPGCLDFAYARLGFERAGSAGCHAQGPGTP